MVQTGRSQHDFLDHAVQLYGDLIFDLCQSVLWSAANAQLAFRAILKELKRTRATNEYQEFERAWVLHVACRQLKKMASRHGRKLTPSERILLDANLVIDERLQQFDSYFHRLPIDDQLVMLLRDKLGLPYPEIAAILGIPEGSLKVRRQQALRALEEWLWETS